MASNGSGDEVSRWSGRRGRALPGGASTSGLRPPSGARAVERGHRPVGRARDRIRRVVLTAATGGLAVPAVSGCSAESVAEWKRIGMPEPASDRADNVLSLWQGTWIAALAVGALVWGLIIWSVIAYRKRDESVPRQTRYHVPIETLFTVVPFIIIAVLFFFTVRDQNAILHVDKENPPEHQINVVGQQWAWTFNYLEDGQAESEGVWETGTPAEPAKLYLPVGERVGVTLNTPDVVHSFFVPAFLFKMDVIPGKANYFEFTPTKEGVYEGRCAELCGTYHARMLFTVHVVSPSEYARHLEELEAMGQTGVAEGAEIQQEGLESGAGKADKEAVR